MNESRAQVVAVEALSYLAANEELLQRFLNLSGIRADQIREAAQTPGFLAGVVQFFLNHEPTLIAYAQATDNDPQDLALALPYLPGGERGDF